MKHVNILALIITLFFSAIVEVYAMGKKYSEQGAKLGAALHDALVSNGFCKTPKECYDLLPSTIETDSMVLLHFYEIGEKNQAAFVTIVALVLTNGIQITGGAPITVKAFRETHEKYRKSGLVIKDIKPFATIEVHK